MSEKDLVDRSVNNILWSVLSFVSTKILNLVAILVLTRFLEPAEFGLMALSLVFIGYFEIFSSFGLGSALIAARDDVEETASAVFLFSLVFSGAMAALMLLTSGLVAQVYDQPVLADILDVLILSLILTASSAVHVSLLQRELRFRDKVLPDIVRGLVKGVVSILLAVLGYGVWSLVYGYLAGTVAATAVLLVLRPWWPRRLPGLSSSWHALRYGMHLISAEFINIIPRTFDHLLVGKILGATPLGIYALSFRIPELALKTFSLAAGTVIQSIMARMQSDPAAVRRYYYACLRYFALLTFPGGAAIAVLSEPMVQVLFTPEWYGMVLPMQFLSIAFAIGTVNLLPGTIYKAINRTDHLLRVSLINLPFFVGVIWIAVPYGIETVAFAQILLALVAYIPNFFVLRRVLGITVLESLRALVPGAACALATAVVGILALEFVGGPPLARLALVALIVAAAYLAALRIAGPEVIAEAVRKLLRRRHAA